jgi:hypothetical protein
VIEHGALVPSIAPLAGKGRRLEPFGAIKSPAFGTVYPQLINPELMAPGVRASMESAWTRGEFAERDIQVFRLDGGYVIDEGLVFDDDLHFITNVDDTYSGEELQRATSDIETLAKANLIPHYEGVGVVAKRRASTTMAIT